MQKEKNYMKKKILVCGADGYLGWPTAMYLSEKGYHVTAIDNFSKRKIENENNIKPLNRIETMQIRVKTWKKISNKKIDFVYLDLNNYKALHDLLSKKKFDAIIHYGEQPSAPYSMVGREQAAFTQNNNVLGTLNLLFAMKRHCPKAHLIKLGTMGVYGTPNIDIEEGYLNIRHKGRRDKCLFPMKPHSFYHLSKAHDSLNIEFACRVWGLKATDLNQGVVYGTEIELKKNHENLNTSFHYDHLFGTVINRFLVQAALDQPLTIYGTGNQTRTFLNINDTMKCIELSIKNPAKNGEYKVRNQFTEVYSINQLANLVKKASEQIGIKCKIKFIKNPRIELKKHYYKPTNKSFINLGLNPLKLNINYLSNEIKKISKYKDNVDLNIIYPTVKWDQAKK